MRSVVVTGVSSGIGWGIARVLIQDGWQVFGSVRKTADAERLNAEFGAGFTPLIFDVTDETGVHDAAQTVHEQLKGAMLGGLINNAGIAVPAPLIHQSIADFRKQLEVNVVGQLIVTQAFVGLLGADRSLQGTPGRIVNISSVSGKSGYPFLGAYAASKHALEGMSESLRRELLLYGIDVIVVGPGAVATPIWDKAEQVDLSPYEKTDYYQAGAGMQTYLVKSGRKGYPPEKIGQVVLTALTAPRPRLRYAVVPGNPLRNWFQSLLPRRIVDGVIAQRMGWKKSR